MALSKGKGRNERDTFHTRTFIIHVFKSKAVMYKQQIESNTTEYSYYLQAQSLRQVYFGGAFFIIGNDASSCERSDTLE